jgi:hypothetical protein
MPPVKQNKSKFLREFTIQLFEMEPFKLILDENLKVSDLIEAIRSSYPECSCLCYPNVPWNERDSPIKNFEPIFRFLPSQGYQIFVRDFNRGIITFCANRETTALEFKKMVEFATGIDVEDQRLLFSGKQLEGDIILSKFDPPIGKESTIQLIRRLRGD